MKKIITKNYFENGIKKKLFENFEIEIDESKITSIVAPLKSGKTTLLKILTGIEQADERISSVTNTFFITSEPMSFPWMSLKQTLLFINKNFDQKKIKEISELVGLEGYEEHLPNNKSLGFRFRIALAAAIAKNSNSVLIDESFQNMEQLTKYELYQLIININAKYDVGFVLGTSNINEAILLSDEIILLKSLPHKTYDKLKVNHLSKNVDERIKSEIFISTYKNLINKINTTDDNKSFNYIL